MSEQGKSIREVLLAKFAHITNSELKRSMTMSNKAIPRTGNNRVKHEGPTYRELRKSKKRAAIKSKRRNRS